MILAINKKDVILENIETLTVQQQEAVFRIY